MISVSEQKQQFWSQCITITNFRPVHWQTSVVWPWTKKHIYNQWPEELHLSDITRRLCLFEINKCNSQIKCQPGRDLASAEVFSLMIHEKWPETQLRAEWCVNEVLYSSDNNYNSWNSKQNHTQKRQSYEYKRWWTSSYWHMRKPSVQVETCLRAPQLWLIKLFYKERPKKGRNHFDLAWNELGGLKKLSRPAKFMPKIQAHAKRKRMMAVAYHLLYECWYQFDIDWTMTYCSRTSSLIITYPWTVPDNTMKRKPPHTLALLCSDHDAGTVK